MSGKWLLPVAVVIAAAGAAVPSAASAQSFDFSISSGDYPPPQYYDPGYAPGYYVPADLGYRRDWRDHERWEREEARRYYWQRERWEEQRDARRDYRRYEHHEHRWHHDDDDE